MKAIQDYYPPDYIFCYGCGAENPSGHHLKSYMLDDHTEARFTPDRCYSAGRPNIVYGGMIASLLDCHGIASAAAFAYRDRGRLMGDAGASIRFVTASLQISFRNPTPLGEELLVIGRLQSLVGRKAYVSLSLMAEGIECAHGELLAIELKETD